MQTVVNTNTLNRWLVANSPNGEAKLSAKSGVSVSTIRNMKAGQAPKKETTQNDIVTAMGCTREDLFLQITTTTSKNGNRKAKGGSHGGR